MKKEKIIEIDVDGVSANMDGYYGKYIGHIIPGFSEETHIFGWGMPEVARDYPEAFEIVKGLWVDEDFIRTVPRYEGVERAIQELDKSIEGKGYKIVKHTHIFNESCAEIRREWLEKLQEDTGVKFEVDICVGDTKVMRETSEILIEDKLENLNNSDAKHKILIRRGHNRAYTEKDIKKVKTVKIEESLESAVKYIIGEILK